MIRAMICLALLATTMSCGGGPAAGEYDALDAAHTEATVLPRDASGGGLSDVVDEDDLPDVGSGDLPAAEVGDQMVAEDVGHADAGEDSEAGPVAPPWPLMQGTYGIETRFPPFGPLPALAALEAGIRGFLEQPGAGLLQVLAAALDGSEFAMVSPWDLLFEVCTGPGAPAAECAVAGQVVATSAGVVAGAHVEYLLDEELGVDLTTTGAKALALFDNLQSFGYRGSLVLPEDPDELGYLGQTLQVHLSQLIWVADGSEFVLYLQGSEFLTAEGFDGRVVPVQPDGSEMALTVGPHALALDYGQVLTSVLERLALSVLLDAQAGAAEEVFLDYLDCESLAERLSCTGEFAGDPSCDAAAAEAGALVETACEVLEASSGGGVAAWRAALAPGQPTSVVLVSPEDAPCLISLDSGTSPPTAKAFGSPASACAWEGLLYTSPGESAALEAEWWAQSL